MSGSLHDFPGVAFMRHLASALAPYLKRELGGDKDAQAFYSQKNSPLGRRVHLELVRRGELPGSKVGKLVLVPREDMHRFIEAHRIAIEESGDAPSDPDDPLRDWGLERTDQ